MLKVIALHFNPSHSPLVFLHSRSIQLGLAAVRYKSGNILSLMRNKQGKTEFVLTWVMSSVVNSCYSVCVIQHGCLIVTHHVKP